MKYFQPGLVGLVMLLCLVLSTSALAQFRVEGGLGHSALYTDTQYEWEPQRLDWTEQFVVPNLKLGYGVSLTKTIWLLPFLGYGESGGQTSSSRGSVYRRYQSIETGILGMFRVGIFSFGGGLRGDIIVRASAPTGRVLAHRYALTGGIRIDLTIADKVPVGVESWYNLTDIDDSESWLSTFRMPDTTYRTHTIRLVVGYIFPDR